MTTTNLWRRLKDLLPEPPLLVGLVTATAAYGVVVELPGGEIVVARGTADIGDTVFVRNGIIEGLAPALPSYLIEI